MHLMCMTASRHYYVPRKKKEKKEEEKKCLLPNYALRSGGINTRSTFFHPSFIHSSSCACLNFFSWKHRLSALLRKEMHSSYAEFMSNSTRAHWWMCSAEKLITVPKIFSISTRAKWQERDCGYYRNVSMASFKRNRNESDPIFTEAWWECLHSIT